MALLKVLLLLLGLGGFDLIRGQNCVETDHLSYVRLEITIFWRTTFCGGSLIHPQWILTAADCWKSNPGINYVIVRVYPRSGPSQVYTFINDFTDKGQNHSIMLLKLQKPVTDVQLAQLIDCGNRPVADIVQLAGEGVMTIGPDNQHLYAVPVPQLLRCVDMKVEKESQYWPRDVYTISAGEPNTSLCHGDPFEDLVLKGTIYGVISLVNHTLTLKNKFQSWMCESTWLSEDY